MGKFPVISISLKSVGGLQYDSAAAALRTVIGNEAGRFRFLRDSAKLDEDDKNSYNRVDQSWHVKASAKLRHARRCVAGSKPQNTLPDFLKSITGQKTILLIDEYDVPLDKAFQRGYYDEMVSLIRSLFDNASENQRQPVLCRAHRVPADFQGKYFHRAEQSESTHDSPMSAMMSTLALPMRTWMRLLGSSMACPPVRM